jgi:hypothetical protein
MKVVLWKAMNDKKENEFSRGRQWLKEAQTFSVVSGMNRRSPQGC